VNGVTAMESGRKRKKQIDEEFKARFAENLYRLRQKHGWNQETLGEKSGVGQNSVSRLETGISKPRQKTVEKLADALGCRVEDLTR
jgi:transcriptional regulator with XRE-family HTH domain